MAGVAGSRRVGILEWATAMVPGDSACAVCDDQRLVIQILSESVSPVCRYRPYHR